MSAHYQAVGWNRHKKTYDLVVVGLVVTCLALFVAVGMWRVPHANPVTLLLRGLGVTGFVLLHLVLSIGPLARLSPVFAPLLYNRRHLGVTMFAVAAAHGLFALGYYHALGDAEPITAMLTANGRLDSVSQFPFQPLGFVALVILALMAATSHDLWLKVLGPRVWKSLHMLVYLAYALVVMHVALGVLQSETSPTLSWALGGGVCWVLGLHAVAAMRTVADDGHMRRAAGSVADEAALRTEGFVPLFKGAREVPTDRARVAALPAGQRVAVFRHGDRLRAVSNLCRHQGGPLGEGRVMDGCITCPWHGWQYRVEDGCSPPPFDEKVETYRLRVVSDAVWIHPTSAPLGSTDEGEEATL